MRQHQQRFGLDQAPPPGQVEGNSAPDQQHGRDDQHAHRVAQPPGQGIGHERLRGNDPGEVEAGHPDRRADHRAEDDADADETQDIAHARERQIEIRPRAQQGRAEQRHARITAGDGDAQRERHLADQVAGEDARPHPDPVAATAEQQHRHRNAAQGPDERNRAGIEREQQPQARDCQADQRKERRFQEISDVIRSCGCFHALASARRAAALSMPHALHYPSDWLCGE